MLGRRLPQVLPFSQRRVLRPVVVALIMVPVVWRPLFRLRGASGFISALGRDAVRCRLLGVPRHCCRQIRPTLRRVVIPFSGRLSSTESCGG